MMENVFVWLLTYWLHSTIALTGMWAASRFWRARNLALEEAGWKVALFATLFTAMMQMGLTRAGEFRPLAGALELQVAGASPVVANRVVDPARELAVEEEAGATATLPTSHVGLSELASRASTASPFEGLSAGPLGVAVALWLLMTAVLMIRLVASYLTLMGRLKDRRELPRGIHVALLDRLRSRAGVIRDVGLSVCAALPVPLALGLRRWEVCLPSRFAEEFDANEQETVLAHELAHLVRYDALWLLAGRALAGALFFQPLNFVATKRLRALSELRCDDWAVERTGRPVTLAKCLTRVASWRSDRWRGLPVPAMAGSSPSQFGARVRRLLERSYPQPQGRVPRWLKVTVAPLVIVFVAAAPGVVKRPEATGSTEVPAAAPAAGQAVVSSLSPEPPSVRAAVPQPSVAPEAPGYSPDEVGGASELPLAPLARRVALAQPTSPMSGKPVSATPSAPRASLGGLDEPAPLESAGGDSAAAPEPPVAPVAQFRAVPLSSARFARLSASGSFVGSDSAPAGRDESEDLQAAETASRPEPDGTDHADDGYPDVHDDELDAIEDEIDAELEELEEALEYEMDALEDELEDQIDAIEDEAEEHFEVVFEEYEDGFEDDIELVEADIEALEQRLESELRDGALSEAQAPAYEAEVERRERHLDRFEEEKDRELERLTREFERTAERLVGRDFERQLERAMEAQGRLIERRMESTARELERAARRLESVRSAEERASLVAEIRERALEMVPTEAELAEIRANVEKVRAELVPRTEELERLQGELRQALEQWRAEYSLELERFRQQTLDEPDRE